LDIKNLTDEQIQKANKMAEAIENDSTKNKHLLEEREQN
jgi:PAB1-binding protein PBP1